MRRRIAAGCIVLLALCLFFTGLAAQRASRAQADPASAQQPVSSVRFAFGGNAAEIPAEFMGHLVFLPVHVNQGGPSLFQLDSTAKTSSIDPGRAAAVGIASLHAPTLNLSGVDVSLPALAAVANETFALTKERSAMIFWRALSSNWITRARRRGSTIPPHTGIPATGRNFI